MFKSKGQCDLDHDECGADLSSAVLKSKGDLDKDSQTWRNGIDAVWFRVNIGAVGLWQWLSCHDSTATFGSVFGDNHWFCDLTICMYFGVQEVATLLSVI